MLKVLASKLILDSGSQTANEKICTLTAMQTSKVLLIQLGVRFSRFTMLVYRQSIYFYPFQNQYQANEILCS